MTDSTRRMLLVHAHPDDETINNGATMAHYAAAGVQVTLVTCTRGEQGEVIPRSLAHLAAAAGGDRDALGDHRVGELAEAMAALGVTDHRFLGDSASPGRRAGEALAGGGAVFRDSGMAYGPDGSVVPSPDPPEGAFALADVERAAGLLADQIRDRRPHVVIGYEPGGGYGHPDHVRAHVVMMRAVDLAELAPPEAGVPGWDVPKVYWAVMPETLVRVGLELISRSEGTGYAGPDPAGRLPSMVVPDEQVSAAIDAMDRTPAKVAALRAHETQVSVSQDGAFYSLSNGIRLPVMGLEFYRLVRGAPAAPLDAEGRETDLFAGL